MSKTKCQKCYKWKFMKYFFEEEIYKNRMDCENCIEKENIKKNKKFRRELKIDAEQPVCCSIEKFLK